MGEGEGGAGEQIHGAGLRRSAGRHVGGQGQEGVARERGSTLARARELEMGKQPNSGWRR